MSAERIVVALGGNALQSGGGPATAQAQLEVVRKTCEHIAAISGRGYEIAVAVSYTHLDVYKRQMLM